MVDATRSAEIAVIGGGIAGLSAALRLRERLGSRARITVFEQGARLGGKLRTEPFAGGYLEAGAETFLMRDPDGSPSAAARLVERVGLGDALRHPTTSQAALAVGDELRPIPRGTLMGVPADESTVDGVARLAVERDGERGGPLLKPGEDVSVGALVRDRLGDEVADRLVDPLLGGVYAGRADDLSLAVTVPALARAARTEPTLRGAVRTAIAASRPTGDAPGGPVFGTVDGGLSRLVAAVADAAGARLMLGRPVRQLSRTSGGWQLVVGSTRDPATIDVDAVVLAVPARPAARLLAGVDPDTAGTIGVLDYANLALVRLAVPEPALPAPAGSAALSGLLVPPVEGYSVKALTIFSAKWDHLRRPDGVVLMRASIGRYGDVAVLQRTDPELVELARDELGRLLGAPLPVPVAADVVRWGGGLPQYRPGHLERVAGARTALAGYPTLVLAGAAYDGVGIPACVRSGEAAADHLLDSMA